jgi:hypothetical protein
MAQDEGFSNRRFTHSKKTDDGSKKQRTEEAPSSKSETETSTRPVVQRRTK